MERQFTRSIQALDEIFDCIERELGGRGVSKKVAFNVKLAIEELFTNMVRHNKGGRDHITLHISMAENKIIAHLVDFDVEPFDHSLVEPVNVHRSIEEIRPGGLGIHIVKNIVDELTYEYDDGNLKVAIVKCLEE